ncbi:F-box and WD-40 domain protein 7 [Nematocida sp. LUAm3]|nr:F-box and WD-40 domain protein 7 [Nematocida sp. LUAm3]KAI5175134.1 F-box and WD-40 domain protein 7 [Nematocida sp. LUAm2]KAI5178194.1 F-box and WD-40 domain protein 7 [Nematocida sp. LUAm1]
MVYEEKKRFPVEIMEEVGRYLSLKEIKKLMEASETAKRTIETNQLIWKRHLRRKKEENGKYLFAVKKEHIATSRWIKNQIGYKREVKYHMPVEITKMQVHGDILVLSSNSPVVHIYDMRLNVLNRLAGHKGSIWTFAYKENILVTGSTDRTAKIWDCFLGLCLFTLSGHKSTIRCVIIAGERVITGSRDATIGVWCIKTGKPIFLLRGHTSSIREVKEVEGKPFIISGSYDGQVILWNYISGEMYKVLLCLPRRIYSLVCIDQSVAAAGMDQRMFFISPDDSKPDRAPLQTGTIFRMETDGQNIYTLTTDGVVSKWNIEKKEEVYSIKTNGKGVDIIVLNHLLVIGLSTQILLHHLETGRYIRSICITESLYSICATEEILFYGARRGSATEIHTIHFKEEKVNK